MTLFSRRIGLYRLLSNILIATKNANNKLFSLGMSVSVPCNPTKLSSYNWQYLFALGIFCG